MSDSPPAAKSTSSSSSASATNHLQSVNADIECELRKTVGRFRNSLTGFALALARVPASAHAAAGVLAYNAAFDDLTVVPCLADLWYADALPAFLAVPCLAPVVSLRARIEENLAGMLLREIDGFPYPTLEALRSRLPEPLQRAVVEYLDCNERTLWGVRGIVRARREGRCALRSPLVEMLASGHIKKDALPRLLTVTIPAVTRVRDVEEHWDREEAA